MITLIGFVIAVHASQSNAAYFDIGKNSHTDGRNDVQVSDTDLGNRKSRSITTFHRTLINILDDAFVLVHTPLMTVYTKTGGYRQALRDFESMKPQDVHELGNGWREGWLGTKITVILEKERNVSGFSVLRIDDTYDNKSYMIQYRQLH